MPVWKHLNRGVYDEVARFFETIEEASKQPDLDEYLRTLIKEERRPNDCLWAAKVLPTRSEAAAATLFREVIADERTSIEFACHLNRSLLSFDESWRLSRGRYDLFERIASTVERDLPASSTTALRHHYASKLHNRLVSSQLGFVDGRDSQEGNRFVREGSLNTDLPTATRRALFDLACKRVGPSEYDIPPCEGLDLILSDCR